MNKVGRLLKKPLQQSKGRMMKILTKAVVVEKETRESLRKYWQSRLQELCNCLVVGIQGGRAIQVEYQFSAWAPGGWWYQ